jgi:hypothetical protein
MTSFPEYKNAVINMPKNLKNFTKYPASSVADPDNFCRGQDPTFQIGQGRIRFWNRILAIKNFAHTIANTKFFA